MVKLVVTNADGVSEEFPVTRAMVLGRNKENDIRLNEEKASRTHCKIKPDNGRVIIEDLGSSNGTRINGHRIKGPYVLRDGDTIKIGKTRIVFNDEEHRLDRTIALPAVDDDDEDEDDEVLPDALPVTSTKAPTKTSKRTRSDKAEEEKESKQSAAVAEEPRVSKRKKAEPEPKPEPEIEHDDEHHDEAHAEEHDDGESETEAEKAARTRREAAEQREFSRNINTIVKLGAVAVFVITVMLVVSHESEWGLGGKVGLANPSATTGGATPVNPPPLPVPGPTNTGTLPLPPPLAGNNPPPVSPPSLPPDVRTTGETLPAKKDDPNLQAQLTKVLAERDKALASGNFPSARTLIQSFAAAHPEGDVGTKARQEWKDTVALIDAALQPLLEGAKRAASEKKYSLATQRCTRLIAADPSGKFGEQAREILSNLDVETEPKFSEYQAQAQGELHAGKLKAAADTLSRALDELNGTKWAATIASMQLEAIMADTLLEQMETERDKRASGGKEPVFNMASKKLEGTLAKVHGVTLDLKMNSGILAVSLKNIDPTDFAQLLESLGLPNKHLEQAYLWLALDRKDAARKELEEALKDPAQATAAAAIAGAVFEMRNLHAWDFSKWQHQSDWDAMAGSWSTQNGKYVLESPEGGDTALRPDAVGGQLGSKNLRISFDFELNNPQNNYLFALEFGPDEQHAVSAIFTAAGLALHSNIGDAASVQEKNWKPAPTHVDVAFEGENFKVTIGGKTQTLQVAGLSNLKGTLTFRVRESAGAISHVIVRTAD